MVVPLESDLLEPDGALVVHEEQGPPISGEAPLVVLLHGLGGDHSSAYLQRLAPRLRTSGRAVWRVDLRGSGAGLTYAWRPANAGSSCDLAVVVRAAQRLHPTRAIQLVGFSLSGNIVLKFLGESACGLHEGVELSQIASAIAIAPPIDLHACSTNMDRPSRRLYTHYYLKVLEAQVQLRRSRWPQWANVPAEPKVKSIRQFDARYTAPLSGFENADDYYTRCSSLGWLPSITTPTTILVDRDDPIVTVSSFDEAELHPATQLIYTRRGGHMGYFGLDDSGRPMRWMEHFVAHTLDTFITRDT